MYRKASFLSPLSQDESWANKQTNECEREKAGGKNNIK